MTIDLDELERYATAAKGVSKAGYYPGQEPQALHDFHAWANPRAVLALIERIRALEAEAADRGIERALNAD